MILQLFVNSFFQFNQYKYYTYLAYQRGFKVTKHAENIHLIQNSQAVKKECGPEKGYGEKRCEIQGGGQEMAVMVG